MDLRIRPRDSLGVVPQVTPTLLWKGSLHWLKLVEWAPGNWLSLLPHADNASVHCHTRLLARDPHACKVSTFTNCVISLCLNFVTVPCGEL